MCRKEIDKVAPGVTQVGTLTSEEQDIKRRKHLEEMTIGNGKSFIHNF